MSTSTDTNQEQVKATVDRLQCEVHEAARKLASAGNEAAHKLREEFGLLRTKALGLAEHGREQAVHARHTLDERVRAEPVKALLIAAGIGVACGLFFARRR